MQLVISYTCKLLKSRIVSHAWGTVIHLWWWWRRRLHIRRYVKTLFRHDVGLIGRHGAVARCKRLKSCYRPRSR